MKLSRNSQTEISHLDKKRIEYGTKIPFDRLSCFCRTDDVNMFTIDLTTP